MIMLEQEQSQYDLHANSPLVCEQCCHAAAGLKNGLSYDLGEFFHLLLMLAEISIQSIAVAISACIFLFAAFFPECFQTEPEDPIQAAERRDLEKTRSNFISECNEVQTSLDKLDCNAEHQTSGERSSLGYFDDRWGAQRSAHGKTKKDVEYDIVKMRQLAVEIERGKGDIRERSQKREIFDKESKYHDDLAKKLRKHAHNESDPDERRRLHIEADEHERRGKLAEQRMSEI